MKGLQRERTLILKNKTNFDRSLQHEGVTIGHELQPTMMPWLLPFLAALSMVIFLVVSFSLHHKRFLQQQRRVSQYYTLRYHRVAGPIFNCSIHEDGVDDHTLDKDGEQTNKFARLTKSLSFKLKLNRYNTWSPNIFRNRMPGHLGNKKRLESENNSEDVLQVFAKLQNLAKGDNNHKVNHRHSSILPGHSSLTSSELLTLADLSGLTRSYSCRARAVGVTTMSGTLAVANYSREETPAYEMLAVGNYSTEETPGLSSKVEVHLTNGRGSAKKTTHSFGHVFTHGSTYDTDGFHSNISRTQRRPRLSRYLEDDSFSLMANETGDVIHGNNVASSRDNSYTGSDDVFRMSPNLDCHDGYTDVIASTSGHSYPHPTAIQLPRTTKFELTPPTDSLTSFHQHSPISSNTEETPIDPCTPRANDGWSSAQDRDASYKSIKQSVHHIVSGTSTELNNCPNKANDDRGHQCKHQFKVGFTNGTMNSPKVKESCLKTPSVSSQANYSLAGTRDTCLVQDIDNAGPENHERPPAKVITSANHFVNQKMRFYDYWDNNATADYLDDSLTSLHNILNA